MKQVCTTRVRYVVKNFPSTGRNSSLGLSVVVAACVVALTPCQTSTAEPMWGQSNNSRNSGAPPLLPRPGDIFNGATSRPEIALPNGNPMGAFRAIGGAGQQGTSMIPAVGQIAEAVGAGPFGQFMGQNNQIMQGMQFMALLQQIFGMFFPADSAMQFNNANTGQSARMAFVNLMGANSSGVDGVPPVSPITAVPCSNGQKDRTKPFNELNASPATQVQLTKLCVKEVGSQGEDAQVALYETLFNRSTGEGNSIDRAMHNGYYEPMNKGTVDSVSTSSSEYASCERALNRALAGSNTIGCRRHAATNCDYAKDFGGDPNSCVTIGGEAFYSKPGESCSGNFC